MAFITQPVLARQRAMAQDFINALYHWFLTAVDVARQLLPIFLIAGAAALTLWLAYEKWSPASQEKRANRLKQASAKTAQILALLLTLLATTAVLTEAHQMVTARRNTLEQAQASRHKEPQLSGVEQYAPRIGYEAERTYTRTLTLPPSFLARVGEEGVQVLSPYLVDPSADGVEKLADTFRKSGEDVVFTRQLTRLDEITIAADSADVKLNFETHRTSSGQRYYQAYFDGTYRFHNPNPAPAPMRFIFPLPQGGGTVQGFFFDVQGAHVTEPDEHGMYSWTGTVPARANLAVHAHYETTGGGSYAYLLGSESRRIGDFHLQATGAEQLKFARSGIYPTAITGASADWNLHDVLTAQSINLVFPSADLEAQLLDKTLSILPLAAVLFAAGAMWLKPKRAVLGLAAFALGLTVIPVTSSYASPAIATLVGCIVAVLGAGAALGGKAGWALAALSGLFCAAFLTAEHGALVAWVLAAGVVAAWGLVNRNRPLEPSPA